MRSIVLRDPLQMSALIRRDALHVTEITQRKNVLNVSRTSRPDRQLFRNVPSTSRIRTESRLSANAGFADRKIIGRELVRINPVTRSLVSEVLRATVERSGPTEPAALMTHRSKKEGRISSGMTKRKRFTPLWLVLAGAQTLRTAPERPRA